MINFTILEKPTLCPSSANCHRFKAGPSGDCTLGHEREAGSSACDSIAWIVPPVSTFDADAIARAFGVDARTLEGVE